MWFDAQAALQKLGGAETPRSETAAPATPARANVADVAGVAGGEATNPILKPDEKQLEPAFPHGASVGGRPLTYTGRVVSLEAWRTLSGWERHGPRARQWCGLCRGWHFPGECGGART